MATKASLAPIIKRFKAFIIDLFLIAVPILYITTYIILDGKDDFQNNQIAIFSVWVIFGVIQSVFFAFKAQSPGYKAQQIYCVNLHGKTANFLIYLFRYFMFVFGFIIGGSILCFFRKDKRNLHDLLSDTLVVQKS